LLSTRNKDLEINAAIISEAETNAPKSGYETRQFYTLAVDPLTGKSVINNTADLTTIDTSIDSTTADAIQATPVRSGYTGYLLGDGYAPNGAAVFGSGIQFPDNAQQDDYFLRTDFMPSRLFRFDSTRWVKVEDSVRMTMTNTDTRNTLKTGFINNTTQTTVVGETFPERQPLSTALKPQADL
jgi:hypothetical protein